MTPLPVYLLDTHVLYWHLFEPAKLSTPVQQAIRAGETGQAVLIIYHLVLAELFYLLQKHSRETDFPIVLTLLQGTPHYRLEPIVLDDIQMLSSYSSVTEMHDRLIVAAARRVGATLLTKDRNIQASPQVSWLW